MRIAGFLAPFGPEILDRLVVEKRIDGAIMRPPVQLVHVAAQLRAPFGNPAGGGDIEDHGESGRGDQLPPEIDVEDDADDDELDKGRSDVEQEEIEHGIDALGAAFDGLGNLAGAARQVEAQRQAVEAAEHILRQLPRCVLPDPLERDIAQLVERDRPNRPSA